MKCKSTFLHNSSRALPFSLMFLETSRPISDSHWTIVLVRTNEGRPNILSCTKSAIKRRTYTECWSSLTMWSGCRSDELSMETNNILTHFFGFNVQYKQFKVNVTRHIKRKIQKGEVRTRLYKDPCITTVNIHNIISELSDIRNCAKTALAPLPAALRQNYRWARADQKQASICTPKQS